MDIRHILRERLFTEAESEEASKKVDNNSSDDRIKAKWYVDVQNALNKDKNPLGPSQVSVMKAIGVEDDEKGINRSLFGKKLHREENSDGGIYEFSKEELGKIRAAIGGF